MWFILLFFLISRTLATETVYLIDSNSKGERDSLISITNGEEVTPHSAPYAVFIEIEDFDKTIYYCGGVILSHYYILTAAHCVDYSLNFKIYIGAHNIRKGDDHQVIVKTRNSKIHENYASIPVRNEVENDIALIPLKSKIEYTPFVQPATLPTKADVDKSYVGQTGRVYGWGYINKQGESSDVLRSADMPVIEHWICQSKYENWICENCICGEKIKQKGSCTGDSGGPYVIDDVLVGIVQGSGCQSKDFDAPSIFTKITDYLDWIEKNSDVIIENK